jgi:transcriptional regulator with XRE-family HTH domain
VRGKRHSIDVHIGGRLRQAREKAAMTLGELASKMDISIHALEEYELGNRRICPSGLLEACDILRIGLNAIFYDLPDATIGPPIPGRPMFASGVARFTAIDDLDNCKTDAFELVEAFYGIADSRIRARLLALMKSFQREGMSSEESLN